MADHIDPDSMEPPMTRRGRKKVLSAEEALQHRRDCAKRCRKRYKRCELEMAPSTLEHLRIIKRRVGDLKNTDKITWNETIHQISGFIEANCENFLSFVHSNPDPPEVDNDLPLQADFVDAVQKAISMQHDLPGVLGDDGGYK